MMPIGPLMIEHRLIERMIRLMDRELRRLVDKGEPDPVFIAQAVDFVRTYADRCHHGKEEDILFCELAKKPLSTEHRRIMDELVAEHAFARQTVRRLAVALDRFVAGEVSASGEILDSLKTLVAVYPPHIEQEDKRFFIPVMAHFSKSEQDAMLAEGWEFDRKLIHEKYRTVVESLEGS
jgi:hemerythrin-like domain-containing protein